MNKLTFRDDDIYLTSSERSGQIYNFEAFKEAHEMLADAGKIHTLAIIASEIDNYPELTEYILGRKDEFAFEVHGWEHSDYVRLDMKDVKIDLQKAKDKIEETFDTECKWFFAPWNRFNGKLVETAKEIGLETNTKYLLPTDEVQNEGVLCFHYWIDFQREQIKPWINQE